MKRLKEHITKKELLELPMAVLRAIARELNVKSPTEKLKPELVQAIIERRFGIIVVNDKKKKGAKPKAHLDVSDYIEEIFEKESGEIISDSLTLNDSGLDGIYEEYQDCVEIYGTFEKIQDFGFLRVKENENSKEDVFVSQQTIAKYKLKEGDKVRGLARQEKNNEAKALKAVVKINDLSPAKFASRKDFEQLVPLYPCEKFILETQENSDDLSIRCIEVFSPIGKGQRGLIVSPPKTGKTTLIKKIARAIESNHKEVKLFLLLIDERPEEVTDIQRYVDSEVYFSTFDEKAEHHIKVAENVLNKAKRLVEGGRDVVILMDSITRLARAYNQSVESSGKILTGGLDPVAMQGPKRFFGTARNIENGGSLTIISTALVDTGSKMDDIIYEELKGTGNMEIHLSRELSEKRIFPAIDIMKSGTRREDLLIPEIELLQIYALRKFLSEQEDATDKVLEMMRKTKNAFDFLSKVEVWLKLYNKK